MFNNLKNIISDVEKHIWANTDGNISWNYCFALDVINNTHKYEMVLSLLEDDESKEVFISLLKYRMTAYIKNISPIPVLYNKANCNINMPKIKDSNGKLISSDVFLRNQYAIPGIFELKEGENVIDGGAWIGDSAIYFSSQVGKNGKVIAFEANSKIAETMKDNLNRNSIYNVDIIQMGLSDKTQVAYIIDSDEGSWIQYTLPGDGIKFFQVPLVDIDNFISKNNIPKIGLVKLDIEGSERSALFGAQKTIKKDKPKLAVSLYHRYDDFHVIPELINSIRSDYKFYIRHNSAELWETVLFAV